MRAGRSHSTNRSGKKDQHGVRAQSTQARARSRGSRRYQAARAVRSPHRWAESTALVWLEHTSAATRSGNSFSYLYNALEQRVYKSGSTGSGTSTSYYAYDESGHLVGEYDATGKSLYETVYLGDLPVAALTQAAIGQTTVSYIYADHLNTARVIVRPSDQAILWTWASTEPFGQTLAANPNSATLGAYTYNPRFPGQVFDAEAGWFYNWNRDYNPAIGGYTSSDPIGLAAGSMSTYAYVGGSPVMWSDPTGLVKHVTGRTIDCGKGCSIRIDYTLNEATGEKIRTCTGSAKARKAPAAKTGVTPTAIAGIRRRSTSSNALSSMVSMVAGAPAGAAFAAGAPGSDSYPEPPYIGEAAAAAGIATGIVLAPEITLPAIGLVGASQ